MLKKEFFKFISTYTIIHHFLFFSGVFLVLSIAYTGIMSLIIDGDCSRFLVILTSLITGDIDRIGISKLWQSGYFAITSIVVLVWQSVLILKLLNRPEYLILSNVLTYYPLDYHNKSNRKEDFLVFRVVNTGYSDLYEVKISVTYRYFDHDSKTFQHYECEVRNSYIPVLSPYMPFRIYIQTGIMKNIRDLYLDPAGIHKADADRLGLDRATIIERPDDQLIVFITGYDSYLDQTKSISRYYRLKDIKYGKFESINPSGGRFLVSEILSKLDMIENNGEWPTCIENR
ncbi:MAG: hypothetical protein D6732_26960 [Methanobacteriota archaeon]|nr:MAG: hypothetical protein D6732_26960 [Euryarchaeota archaeon]